MTLTDITVRNAKPKDKAYKLSDARGLHLLVKPTGGKYWRLKYRIAGKERLLSIAPYPDMTLSEAREKALEVRKQLASGLDPSELKREKKLKQMSEVENSFESVARCWHNSQKHRWTERHAGRIFKRLSDDVFPRIGFKAIADIKPPELLETLRIIETRGALDIAHRALQTCGQIFRYAVATGRVERDITGDLRGALKVRKQENHAYLKAKELPEFFENLEKYNGEPQTKLALKLLILTFVRTTEVRAARWSEIDFDKQEWRIPAERMKMRDPHIVPLSKQAIDILRKLKLITSFSEHLFPNRSNPMSYMSENTMLYTLYRLGYKDRTTTHGFRATASTILNEHGFAPDVIERQLAHAERNKVRASYNHAQYLPERRKMMAWWGDYIEGCSASKYCTTEQH